MPGRGDQLKAGEHNGMVWGVLPANVSQLTEIRVDKWQLLGESVKSCPFAHSNLAFL